ncbi:GNAT family N-acetyltransferase [Labrys wisconsinensis]|uniref:Phosphinothricin acetyltransferase n=1 Tax=Labrys wisconsinensis TaxID=425677 RepID=A0ABU0IZR3_9HYPH|nr:GNAT family N-acetyltransferase [Labrys wisconsinensis]MDQ0467501.1 phosphinothricin acetyltransferase [Labrys wisconsinensis]
MHEVRLRLVEGRDIPSIGDIYREAVRFGSASFELDPPSDEEMTRRMRGLVEGGFPYFVATRGYEILGYAYAGPYRPRPAYRFTLEDSVYVAAHAQGTGLGRRLLGTLVAESEKRGFRQMIAVIGDSANRASIALHERAGFRHAGTLEAVGWKHGRWLDSVLMQRTLGPGNGTLPAE